jgi:UrcA family protein
MLKTLPALAALVIASALVVPTVSQAAEQDSMRVTYADLNIASDMGQQQLEKRIAFAASVVCGPADHRDVPYVQLVGECRTATYNDAQPAFQAAVASARRGEVEILGAALIVTAH